MFIMPPKFLLRFLNMTQTPSRYHKTEFAKQTFDCGSSSVTLVCIAYVHKQANCKCLSCCQMIRFPCTKQVFYLCLRACLRSGRLKWFTSLGLRRNLDQLPSIFAPCASSCRPERETKVRFVRFYPKTLNRPAEYDSNLLIQTVNCKYRIQMARVPGYFAYVFEY